MAQAKVGEVTARIVLLNVCGYFDPLVAMLDRSTQTGLNSTDWRDYGDVFVTADEALDYLEAHAR
jgi:predicted Rossmann-fold nucleotide-binding protein